MRVWQRSIDLAPASYKYTNSFPIEERYGLVSQIRSAAVSIARNIAEGQGRETPGELLNHLSNARGSMQELETLFIFSEHLEMLTARQLDTLLEICVHVSRMLTRLRNSVKR